MDHLNVLIERYGEPTSLSDDWASFHHGCEQEKKLGGGEYALLLYNRNSGWVTCKACGHHYRSRVGAGDALPKRTEQDLREDLRGDLGKLVPALSPEAITAPAKYLFERGLTAGEIEAFGCLAYRNPSIVPPGERPPLEEVLRDPHKPPLLSQYAIFPIYQDGEIVSWQGRALDPGVTGRQKYMSQPGYNIRQHLWGIDRLDICDVVFVCEGIFDAAFFTTGVAIFGPVPTEQQVQAIINKKPQRVVIACDNDMDPDLWVRAFKKKDRYLPVTLAGEFDATLRLPPPTPEKPKSDYGEWLARGTRFLCTEGYTGMVPVNLVERGELWYLDMKETNLET